MAIVTALCTHVLEFPVHVSHPMTLQEYRTVYYFLLEAHGVRHYYISKPMFGRLDKN